MLNLFTTDFLNSRYISSISKEPFLLFVHTITLLLPHIYFHNCLLTASWYIRRPPVLSDTWIGDIVSLPALLLKLKTSLTFYATFIYYTITKWIFPEPVFALIHCPMSGSNLYIFAYHCLFHKYVYRHICLHTVHHHVHFRALRWEKIRLNFAYIYIFKDNNEKDREIFINTICWRDPKFIVLWILSILYSEIYHFT